MRFLPPRRWFQFRLSTWFVLVAILAYAMTCRPWWSTRDLLMGIESHRLQPLGWTYEGSEPFDGKVLMFWSLPKNRPNPELVRPALALAAFLAWKAAWAVVQRRRRQTAATRWGHNRFRRVAAVCRSARSAL